jgi:protein arginine kinase
VVVSSRVRLARNLRNAPFPGHAKAPELKMILETVFDAAEKVPAFRGGHFWRLARTPRLLQEMLKERHLISQNMCDAPGDRGLALDAEGKSPVMVNEEDHLRLSAIEPGFQLAAAWERVNALDEALGAKLAWAYDAEWGFLTACPTNCGTGMRVSARLHLPALGLLGQLPPLLQSLGRLGLAVRGFHGEGTQALGDIYQVSNAATLGRSEPEILRHVSNTVKRLVRHEQEAREKIKAPPHAGAMEDQAYRAMAVLLSARRIGYEETMSLLSRVRLGLFLGYPLPVSLPTLHRIMVVAQPAHLQDMRGKELRPDERDFFRAETVRHLLRQDPSGTSSPFP